MTKGLNTSSQAVQYLRHFLKFYNVYLGDCIFRCLMYMLLVFCRRLPVQNWAVYLNKYIQLTTFAKRIIPNGVSMQYKHEPGSPQISAPHLCMCRNFSVFHLCTHICMFVERNVFVPIRYSCTSANLEIRL